MFKKGDKVIVTGKGYHSIPDGSIGIVLENCVKKTKSVSVSSEAFYTSQYVNLVDLKLADKLSMRKQIRMSFIEKLEAIEEANNLPCDTFQSFYIKTDNYKWRKGSKVYVYKKSSWDQWAGQLYDCHLWGTGVSNGIEIAGIHLTTIQNVV